MSNLKLQKKPNQKNQKHQLQNHPRVKATVQHEQSIKIISAAQSMLSASIHSFPQAQDKKLRKE